jgi:hypothetical protein
VLRFQVTAILGGRNVPVASAVIHLGHRLLRTDRRGRASLVVRFSHPTRLRIRVTASGYTRAATTIIRVVKRR